jgi:hypothetical protein
VETPGQAGGSGSNGSNHSSSAASQQPPCFNESALFEEAEVPFTHTAASLSGLRLGALKRLARQDVVGEAARGRALPPRRVLPPRAPCLLSVGRGGSVRRCGGTVLRSVLRN